MIFSYIVGFAITFLSIFMFQLLGVCLTKNKKSDSYSFVVGYIVYSFFVAIIGVPLQLLNLSWSVFFIYMILLILGILFYISYSFKKKIVFITKRRLIDYIKNNWFLYIGAFIILIFALGHIDYIWANNLTDDGFYINKIATLPYIDNPFRTDPVTGFIENSFNSYFFNTFELEASFYLYISGLSATLYTRFFLALLNYFILLNAIRAFIYQIFNRDTDNVTEYLLQFIVVPVFLLVVMNASLLFTSDANWTITSAAYYGSSLVRVGCPFICLLPLINERNLNIKKVIFTALVCIVMVSKSTIAIPTLFVLAISYVLLISKKWQFLSTLFFIITLGLIFPSFTNNEIFIQGVFLKNISSISIIFCFIVCLFFSHKNKSYMYLLFMIIISFLLMLIPEINDIFENLSIYSFVADRTLYSILIWLQVTAFCSLSIIIFQKINKKKLIILSEIGLIIFSFLISSYNRIDKVSLFDSMRIYKQNINLVPNNTMQLGYELEKYYEETGINPVMVMTAGLVLNERDHFPAAIIRSFSPHTISVVGALRTQAEYINKESKFNEFNLDDLTIINEFMNDPNENTLQALNLLNEEYPINCIVGVNMEDKHTVFLKQIGYHKYKDVTDNTLSYTYNIFVKD